MRMPGIPTHFAIRMHGKGAATHGPGLLAGNHGGRGLPAARCELEPGDRLCFYTDGILEARNEIGELFGEHRLEECLAAHGNETAKELKDRILEEQQTFRGSIPLGDDVTLMVGEMV